MHWKLISLCLLRNKMSFHEIVKGKIPEIFCWKSYTFIKDLFFDTLSAHLDAE